MPSSGEPNIINDSLNSTAGVKLTSFAYGKSAKHLVIFMYVFALILQVGYHICFSPDGRPREQRVSRHATYPRHGKQHRSPHGRRASIVWIAV